MGTVYIEDKGYRGNNHIIDFSVHRGRSVDEIYTESAKGINHRGKRSRDPCKMSAFNYPHNKAEDHKSNDRGVYLNRMYWISERYIESIKGNAPGQSSWPAIIRSIEKMAYMNKDQPDKSAQHKSVKPAPKIFLLTFT